MVHRMSSAVEVPMGLAALVITALVLQAIWRFGHSGVWGELAARYADATVRVNDGGKDKRAVIFLRAKDRWAQWSIWRIRFDEGALLFLTPSWISWAIPSLRIPYGNIEVGEAIKPWLDKYIVLRIMGSNGCIAVNQSLLPELSLRIRKATP